MIQKTPIKRIIRAYRELLGILVPEAPVMVVMTFFVAIMLGLMQFATVVVNRHIFDDGYALAQGQLTFSQYLPYVIAFVLLAVLPTLLMDVYIYGYVEPRALLILRTVFKERMLKKLKCMKYEHMENSESLEIIDKAYNRTEHAARHLFPMYVMIFAVNLTASLAILIYVGTIIWWLPLTILIPAVAESFYSARHVENIYLEIEGYWNRERRYTLLGEYLRSRLFAKEIKLFGSADYLIDTFRCRLNTRNREYERFFFRHLKASFLSFNITKVAKIINVLLMLYLFLNGQVSIGIFIALSYMILNEIFESITRGFGIMRWSGYHINFFDYYEKYFELSEDEVVQTDQIPEHFDVEFRNVWFRYPGTDRDILKGLSFQMHEGEKLSVVGENGEGKTTMIKLLLGLFMPDQGEILLGGKPLMSWSHAARTRVFGPVFQDFIRYDISLRENIGIGGLDHLQDDQVLQKAAYKGKVDSFVGKLPDGYETILGRVFEGGVDLSGGQWQRVAIARAFMGDKPILLLDEPTSQLDPVAESQLYKNFAAMASGKTALFITHRLASTMITDRILVIRDGIVAQEGSHSTLMAAGGLYTDMFNAQKQWYQHDPVQKVEGDSRGQN